MLQNNGLGFYIAKKCWIIVIINIEQEETPKLYVRQERYLFIFSSTISLYNKYKNIFVHSANIMY